MSGWCEHRDISNGPYQQAVDFFDLVCENMEDDGNAYVSGHSQGGNDAQIVSILSINNNKIEKCYSFDGEGASEKLVLDKKGKIGNTEFDRLTSKLYSVSGKQDPVHRLGYVIVPDDNTKYIDIQFDVSDALRCHDIVSMFADRDSFGKIEYKGLIAASLEENNNKIEEGIVPRIAENKWKNMQRYPDKIEEGAEVYIMDKIQKKFSHGKVTNGIEGRGLTDEDVLSFNKIMNEEIVNIPLGLYK